MGGTITTLDDDDDEMGPPGALPAGDPTQTVMFKAPELTKGKAELGDGWGRLSVTFDQALTGAMFKIPPVCKDFQNVPGSGFSNGMKTVLVGPGDYKIPVGATVTLEVSSNADVKIVSATWVSKKKLDDPNNTPASPIPEPSTWLSLSIGLIGMPAYKWAQLRRRPA